MQRLLKTAHWLLIEPWALWASLAVPALAWLAAAALPGQPEFRVRVAATFISVIGVILVVHQIIATQRLFERPQLTTRVTTWIERGRRIWKRPHEIRGIGAATLTIGVKGSGVTLHHSDGSLETRMWILEERVGALKSIVGSLSHSLEARMAEIKSSVQTEGVSRAMEIGQLAQRLDSVAADGFSAEMFGVALLIWGQVFSTFPEELGRCLP